MLRASAIMALLLLPACSIPADKMLHMGAGAGIAGVTLGAGGSWQQACGVSMAIGAAKEISDSTGRGTADAMDAVATGLIGCAFAWAMGGVTASPSTAIDLAADKPKEGLM